MHVSLLIIVSFSSSINRVDPSGAFRGNQKVNRVLVLINFQKIGELQQVIGNPRKIEDVVEPNSPYTASSTSNGTMPAAQGIQPMQQTAMYGAPSGVYAAAPGGAPMGQVQQQMAGGYGQPAQAYAQPPGPGQYSNVQQPGPTPYGNAPHPGPTPYGNAQQATLGTYGNAPPQQYGSNGGPNAAYGGNQVWILFCRLRHVLMGSFAPFIMMSGSLNVPRL